MIAEEAVGVDYLQFFKARVQSFFALWDRQASHTLQQLRVLERADSDMEKAVKSVVETETLSEKAKEVLEKQKARTMQIIKQAGSFDTYMHDQAQYNHWKAKHGGGGPDGGRESDGETEDDDDFDEAIYDTGHQAAGKDDDATNGAY
ncbi:unnamed protein product, partial [Amoebophrya sp. A120]|eukprot:GSA120T00009023001.1